MLFNSFIKLIVNIFLIVSSIIISGTYLSPAEYESVLTGSVTTGDLAGNAIKPYSKNPWYFEFRGEPVVLIGGSDIDSPFQWTGSRLTDHLDLMVSVGGNYIRNTMSDRNEGNVYAFNRTESGVYDLDQWNEEYWQRLEFFLDETSKRGIVVQLSLWDQFDLHPEHPWLTNINIEAEPDNNRTESAGSTEVFHEFSRSDFYQSVEDQNEDFLHYQQKYVDRILDLTLTHAHILYNINNESSEGKIWENYWAKYIKQKARENNRDIYVTSMQFDPSNTVRHIMTYSYIYDFYDISQNNQDSRGARGPAHWENLMNWRAKIASDRIMPMTNEKIYGGQDGINYSAGTETEAVNRFWRNIFAGCAAARFHRPALPHVWGSGLNNRVQTNLKAMDMLLKEFDIFSASPHNDLIRHRVASVPNSVEAYVSADIGSQYAVYFPPGRFMIDLDPWVYTESVSIRWLDIDQFSWSEKEIVNVEWAGSRDDWGDRGTITLKTPSNRPYVAFIETL